MIVSSVCLVLLQNLGPSLFVKQDQEQNGKPHVREVTAPGSIGASTWEFQDGFQHAYSDLSIMQKYMNLV